jgi:hypothetical protein
VNAAYGRYGHRLVFEALSVGDPSAPAGVVYRWNDLDGDRRPTTIELTAVDAVGPCCGTTPRDSIATGLSRPTTRELVLGMEHTFGSWRWRISGIDRRESNQLVLAEVGLSPADFDVRLVEDPGIVLAAVVTTATLPIASRRPSSFMKNAAQLTNAAGVPGRYQAAEIDVERAMGAWTFRFGGLTHRAEMAGGNRGYRWDENDPGVLGELGVNPNAAVFARGRVFFDRAYIIKVGGDYMAPGGVRVSAAARYMDGQPFARVVVADGLGQGTDLVPTYPRGGQRFTYALTLDGRVEKRIQAGRASVALFGEALNLLDLAHEVEEDIVTGPLFRTVTAVQPPRSFRVGLGLSF